MAAALEGNESLAHLPSCLTMPDGRSWGLEAVGATGAIKKERKEKWAEVTGLCEHQEGARIRDGRKGLGSRGRDPEGRGYMKIRHIV